MIELPIYHATSCNVIVDRAKTPEPFCNCGATNQQKEDSKWFVDWLRKQHQSSHHGFGHYKIKEHDIQELKRQAG